LLGVLHDCRGCFGGRCRCRLCRFRACFRLCHSRVGLGRGQLCFGRGQLCFGRGQLCPHRRRRLLLRLLLRDSNRGSADRDRQRQRNGADRSSGHELLASKVVANALVQIVERVHVHVTDCLVRDSSADT
jgi:hypothetical protein